MLLATRGSSPGLAPAPPRGRARFWLGMGALVAALLVVQLLHPQQILRPLVERTQDAGWLGPALLGALYLPAALVGLPLSLLTFTAGWFFGPVTGLLVAVPACTTGSCLAFAVGRSLAGDPQFLARGKGTLAETARRLGTRHGFWATVILRLVPLAPFSVLNFAFGATPISPGTFALATLVGSIPACLGFAYAGARLGGMW